MTNVLAATALPTVFLPYAISLRRTQPRERKFWWLLSLTGLFAGMLLALIAFTGSHITLGGAFAIVLLPTMLLIVCAGVVEAMAASGDGPHQYRQRVEASRAKATLMWEVRSVITEHSDDVEIRVYRGQYHRPVGSADPVDEPEAYHALIAKANEVAGTLNSLGVETVSTALVEQ